MKKDNNIKNKTFAFAVRIINLYKFLTNEKKEYILSKQILRSGTSIGAQTTERQIMQKAKKISYTNLQYLKKKPTKQFIG